MHHYIIPGVLGNILGWVILLFIVLLPYIMLILYSIFEDSRFVKFINSWFE